MTETNVKIRTEDIYEILDTKIKASASHAQLGVVDGDFYDVVLSKIAERSPSIDEKDALNASYNPTALNRFVSLSDLTTSLSGTMPWKTIGYVGSGADYLGNTEAPFNAAFAAGDLWLYIKPGTYTFSTTLVVPPNVRLIGSNTSETKLVSSTGTVVTLGDNAYLSFLSVIAASDAITALDVSSTTGVLVNNCILTSSSTGKTILVEDANTLMLVECALMIGNLSGDNMTDSIFESLYVDASGLAGISLTTPKNLLMWGSTFFAGVPSLTDCENVRVVGNHFSNGIDTTGDTTKRANTPSSTNNEDESLTYLLQYLGSLSTAQTNPAYSSNFAGPQGQDITARASAIDLLLQWSYEERNFSLVAETEPMTLTWSPSTAVLNVSGIMHLVSAHREYIWKIAQISSLTIPEGNFLYYVLNRDIVGDTTLPFDISVNIKPLGAFPNLETNSPTGTPENRQVIVLAYNLNGTLWWRGGGGTRLSATGSQTGEYYVDGSSKSLLTYIGAIDYNDSDPNYTHNFAGINGESLTTRLSKTDTLIQRLFEYSNLCYRLSAGSFLYTEGNILTLSGALYFMLPHTTCTIQVDPLSALATTGESFADGELIYLTWNQIDTPINQTATVTKATTVPLVSPYPLTTKYFVLAIRSGSEIILWDGTKLPIIGSGSGFAGGRWPVPVGRSVVRTAVPTVIPTLTSGGYSLGYTDNIAWDGTNILWENLAVATSTGVALTRNSLVNKTAAVPGLTDLTDGTGLVISHTWNTGSGSAQNVSVTKVTLSSMTALAQNQFLWAYNRGGYLFFEDTP